MTVWKLDFYKGKQDVKRKWLGNIMQLVVKIYKTMAASINQFLFGTALVLLCVSALSLSHSLTHLCPNNPF